ncbi:hypothetical protein [Bacillus sp. FJAT-49736]|uniref:hypothetical protein n=1 Tax=Bacillus sp. FJAT-49736 TaxID=2833582 RepID=UPI001BC8CAEA|nr:hypothetical protein [Bacillus sp. FJAT-49736]MBS4174377.1 hypothetical protein [Bacillus sp. FJAT-49736]
MNRGQKMKECLRILIGIIAIVLFLIPATRLYKFNSEIKMAKKDNMLSEQLIEHWYRNFYTIIAFIVVGMILALLFSFLS